MSALNVSAPLTAVIVVVTEDASHPWRKPLAVAVAPGPQAVVRFHVPTKLPPHPMKVAQAAGSPPLPPLVLLLQLANEPSNDTANANRFIRPS
jgi:hypothetical protein